MIDLAEISRTTEGKEDCFEEFKRLIVVMDGRGGLAERCIGLK